MFDGALFVVDARQKFPQPQDGEHLQAIFVLESKNIIFAQNKIDIVDLERATQNYDELLAKIKDTSLENSPTIPVSGQHKVNIDALLCAIQKYIPTPQRDLSKPFRIPILRSFDVNVPGTMADKMTGGVIGGSIIQGRAKVGDEIEIRPGLPEKENDPKSKFSPLFAEILNIRTGGRSVKEARSGGLTGIETTLDPSWTRANGLTGNTAGTPGDIPPVRSHLTLEYNLFERVIGLEGGMAVRPIAEKEPLVLNVYSAVTSGIAQKRTSEALEIELTRPVCADEGNKVTVSRRIGGGWRLIGFGKIV